MATQIDVGGCADIEPTNPKDQAVSGTYMRLPEDAKKDAPAKA